MKTNQERLIERSVRVTEATYSYGARIACALHSHKMLLIEKSDGTYGVSQSVERYLNTLIYNYNKQVEGRYPLS